MACLWKWKCPICGNQGGLKKHRYKVRRTGKVHIRRIHNMEMEPIILKFKVNIKK